ncbi:hypothetical protein OS493_032560 [Desmophyllum pertusum]|uniref:Uncharacterized protein n=1 Tax=Desmophyllum pertusum TaxID=174260 RepID=A0A9W9YX84_9CNID|nr:hypothetical protein OS493_032560 [Desmophyllum pertusum]
MDYHGLQARLADLKTAEMAALRRGDTKAAERIVRLCRIYFLTVLLLFIFSAGKDSLLCGIGGQMNRAVITVILKIAFQKMQKVMKAKDKSALETAEEEDIDLFSTYAESEENQEEEDPGTAEEEDTREEKDKESYSDGSEEEEATCKKAGKREKKPCPLPHCNAKVVHLRSTSEMFMTGRKNMREQHYRASSCEKSTSFTSQETASAGNRRAKPKPKESTSCKNPHRKRKLCPLPGLHGVYRATTTASTEKTQIKKR